MKHTKSIAEIINSEDEYEKLLRVTEKAQKRRKRQPPTAPQIGHFVAMIIFGKLFFVDRVELVKSYTSVWDGNKIVILPFCPQEETLERGILKIIYTNQVEIKLFRIS